MIKKPLKDLEKKVEEQSIAIFDCSVTVYDGASQNHPMQTIIATNALEALRKFADTLPLFEVAIEIRIFPSSAVVIPDNVPRGTIYNKVVDPFEAGYSASKQGKSKKQ